MRLFPKTVHNPISYLGAAIAALAGLIFLFLVILDTFAGGQQAPYAGLVMFIIVPAVLLIGLVLVPIGMVAERRRLRRTGAESIPRFPVIDLNQPWQRNATFVFVIGSISLLFLSAFGSYQAYEATESVAFCGTLCHTPMLPEHTAYQNSPHARVRCVDCHVGPGANWYIRSKLSGAYQVYATLTDRFPRPIPAPITSLRPAQDTCEQCHWPEQFYEWPVKRIVHFLPDEANTRWEIDLMIKIGGGGYQQERAEGIHWHMNIENRVEYFATDPRREDIPWTRVTNMQTGEIKTYIADGFKREDVDPAQIRVMDCIDCHNRPTHIFRSPARAINLAMANGKMDPSLPFLKKVGVDLLSAEYASTVEARAEIEQGLLEYYQENHPEVARARASDVRQASAALQEIYANNMFPEMGVRWDVYPDNIGHFTFAGCYRCHDGSHRNDRGVLLSDDCRSCHLIQAQGPASAKTYTTDGRGLDFQHPEDIGEMWREMKCRDCHAGGA